MEVSEPGPKPPRDCCPWGLLRPPVSLPAPLASPHTALQGGAESPWSPCAPSVGQQPSSSGAAAQLREACVRSAAIYQALTVF